MFTCQDRRIQIIKVISSDDSRHALYSGEIGWPIIKHSGFTWSLYLGKNYPYSCLPRLASHVTLQCVYAVLHPVKPSPALCLPVLHRGKTVTAHWLSQGRIKREAGTSTQVRYLINLSLILVSLTLILPHQNQNDAMTAFGHSFNCSLLDRYILLVIRVKV